MPHTGDYGLGGLAGRRKRGTTKRQPAPVATGRLPVPVVTGDLTGGLPSVPPRRLKEKRRGRFGRRKA